MTSYDNYGNRITLPKNENSDERRTSDCPILRLADREPCGVVCQVCGHINKGDSMICKMCSNYLFD